MKASSPPDRSSLASSPPPAEEGEVRSWILDVEEEPVAPSAPPASWLLELDRDPARPAPGITPPAQVQVAWCEPRIEPRWRSAPFRILALLLVGSVLIGTVEALLKTDETEASPERVLEPSESQRPTGEVELVSPDEPAPRHVSRGRR